MRRPSPLLLLLIVAVAAALAAAGWSREASRREDGGAGSARLARVERVVDGDTIVVRLEDAGRRERVRYIGVDTPESVKPGTPVQCYAKAAARENARLVAGRRVRWCATSTRATASAACWPTWSAPTTGAR